MGSIHKQMNLVMQEIGAVSKNQQNQAQGFKFRGIDQFINTLYPALCKHGVFMAPECTDAKQEIREVVRSNGKPGVDKHVTIMMKYTFYATDGSSVTVGPIPAEGVDSGDKATNKSLSAALKYALIQTFSIPTEDMVDGDSESPELGRKANAAKPVAFKADPGIPEKGAIDPPKTVGVAGGLASAPIETKPSFKKPTKKEVKPSDDKGTSESGTTNQSSSGGDAEGWT